VLAFLRRTGLATATETPVIEPLSGGVSSDIWRIDLERGPVCVKRALPRLRVAQPWEAPVERNRYERRWMETVAAIVPQAAPRVLAHDDEAGLFAMEYLDAEAHPVWKERLRHGIAEASFAAAVGKTLGTIHAATARRQELAAAFATDASFHALRLEPYLLATAARHPDLGETLCSLARRTADTKLCLVHGDVSPKNILAGPRGPVILDAECAWFGDPAFDLAFCLNHLLLKCIWVPRATPDFLQCFDALAGAYLAQAAWEPRAGLEERAVTLLPGLLLARIDGKSPVEYLGESDRQRVREHARGWLVHRPCSLAGLRAAWPPEFVRRRRRHGKNR
jgi:aminoglycoside phosphotransferase (APT) family kinase protein